MKTTAVVVALLGCVSLISALNVEFENCFSKGDIGKASAVDISPCDKEPCALRHGSNVTVNIKFTATAVSKTVKGIVHGVIAGLPLPFPIPHPDGCTDSGLTCPLKTGTELSYHSSFPIKSIYPKMKLVVKYELKGDDDKNLSCIQVPVHIE